MLDQSLRLWVKGSAEILACAAEVPEFPEEFCHELWPTIRLYAIRQPVVPKHVVEVQLCGRLR
eukprot:3150073-Rhodomonas_salina.1